jgi:CRP-like cAMP-binding protein
MKGNEMAVAPEILKGMDIFEFLKLEELQDIAQLAKTEEFEQGEFIFKEGDRAEKIYMVLEGRVSIEITIYPGKMAPVYTMTKGRFFGYPSMLRTRRFTTAARCLDKVKVVSIVADELENKIFKKDCRRGYLVMKRVAELIAQKLSDTRMQLLSLVQP